VHVVDILLPAIKMPREKVQEYWIEDSVKDKAFDDYYILGDELGK